MNMIAKKPYVKKKKVQKFFAMTQKAKDAYAHALTFMKEEYEIALFEKKLDEQLPGWKTSRYLIMNKQSYDGHIYTGYNIPMLYPYKDDIFITLKHIEKLGAKLKNNALEAFIAGWFPFSKKKTETEEEFRKRTLFNKGCYTSYTVYGVSQVDNLPEKKRKDNLPTNIRNESIEDFISRFINSRTIQVEELGSIPQFDVTTNTITIPNINQCESSDSYYFTLFKEFILIEGVKLKIFDDEDQAHEVYNIPALIAEIGSAALCHLLSCKVPTDSSDYIYTWMNKMSEDSSVLPWATKKAEEIFNSLLK